LRKITDRLGVKDRVKGTLARLERAGEIRNHIAHSAITIDIQAPVEKDMFRWHSQRWSRKGYNLQYVEESVLREQADFVSRVESEVFRIVSAFYGRKGGADLGNALDEIDRLNPDLAKSADAPL
jgi:hypothetical protein